MGELVSEFEKYKSKIDNALSEYVDLLGGDYDRLKQADTFNGLINYICSRVFHGPYNKDIHSTTTVNICNVSLISDIFDYYVTLSSLYIHKPYILQFCLLIDIDKSTFEKWASGEERPNLDRIRMCQKIRQTCEQAQVSADTVKSIFLLKSKYGYVETPQQIQITTEINQPTDSLIDKYREYPKLS